MAVFPFSALPRRMALLAQGVDRGTARLMQRVAVYNHAEQVVNSPVDEGSLRANWFLTLGPNYNFGRIKAYPKGSMAAGQGATERIVAQAALTAAMPIARMNFKTSRGLEFWVQNNTPYILRLNNGWVTQMPAGFIERGLAAARNRARRLRISEFVDLPRR